MNPFTRLVKQHVVALGCVVSLLFAGRSVADNIVNLSHYDPAVPDFAQMRHEGILGIIHEATYPPGAADAKYVSRQHAALNAQLLWGAYHFANGSDPVRQADQFLNFVANHAPGGGNGVLLVL